MVDCEKTAEQLFYEISELLIRCEILEKEASEYEQLEIEIQDAREYAENSIMLTSEDTF